MNAASCHKKILFILSILSCLFSGSSIRPNPYRVPNPPYGLVYLTQSTKAEVFTLVGATPHQVLSRHFQRFIIIFIPPSSIVGISEM